MPRSNYCWYCKRTSLKHIIKNFDKKHNSLTNNYLLKHTQQFRGVCRHFSREGRTERVKNFYILRCFFLPFLIKQKDFENLVQFCFKFIKFIEIIVLKKLLLWRRFRWTKFEKLGFKGETAMRIIEFKCSSVNRVRRWDSFIFMIEIACLQQYICQLTNLDFCISQQNWILFFFEARVKLK